MTKTIEVEDFGATLSEAILAISAAMEALPITDRALALLLSDASGLTMTQCMNAIKYLRLLELRYTK